jgi:hypothetical protein
MEKPWRSGPLVASIADGIGERVPIREAVDDMQGIADDVLLVEDSDIIAAIQAHPDGFRGRRVAPVLCGSNLTDVQIKSGVTAKLQPGSRTSAAACRRAAGGVA